MADLNPLSDAAARLDKVRVILSHAQHPGNIGAAARAMKTMGLARLYLVNPRRFPDDEATARAAGAADMLQQAVVCASLDEALRGVVFSVAISARGRELGPPERTARQAAFELLEQLGQLERLGQVDDPVSAAAAGAADGAADGAGGDVAIVFGNETAGLSNDEVMRCDRLATIPTRADFSSLNLGAAVQIVAYELRLAAFGDAVPPSKATPLASRPATRDEIEGLFAHLEGVMIASRFLDPAQPKRLLPKLRRMFSRTQLEKEEVNILRGLLAALALPNVAAKEVATAAAKDCAKNDVIGAKNS